MSLLPRHTPRTLLLLASVAAGTVGLSAPGVARGQPAAPAAAPAAVAPLPVAAYLDETALAVVEIDLSRVDVDAAVAWATALLKRGGLPKEELDKAVGGMAGPAGHLKKGLAAVAEAGGRRVYLVGMMNQQAPFVLVLPPADGIDPAKLAGLFAGGTTLPKEMTEGTKAEVVGGAVVWGPPGAVAAVKDVHANADRAARPDIGAALAAAGDAAVRVAFAPPEHVKGLLSITQPNLPPEIGGGPTGAVVNAFKYLSLAVDLPKGDAAKLGAVPTAAVRLTVQARDAAGAQKLKGVVDAAMKSLRADQGFRRDVPNGEKLLAVVTPAVAGDKLTITLDQPAIESGVTLGMPALFAAREQAQRLQSMSNVRQLLIGVIMYSNENKGRLPENFPGDLAPYLGGEPNMAAVVRNPAQPGRSPAYVYVRPAGAAKITDVKNAAGTVLVYEAYGAWPAKGIVVGFVDGHAELVADEAQFKKLLARKE
jgi:hypothetical protein